MYKPILVRAARPEDAAEIRLVDSSACRSLRETCGQSIGNGEEWGELPDGLQTLVACVDGKVVGALRWYVEDTRIFASRIRTGLQHASGSGCRGWPQSSTVIQIVQCAVPIHPRFEVGGERFEWCVKSASVRAVCIGVLADYRRNGVCRALLESLASMCRDAKVDRLRLHTAKATGNIVIFERMGFRIVSEDPHLAPGGVDRELIFVEMEKSLGH